MSSDTGTAPTIETAPTLKEADEDSGSAAFLERQISEIMPNMPAEMRGVVARLGAAIAKKSTTQAQPEPKPLKEEPKGELILFPQWAEDRRAAANAIFRSALFPVLNNKQPRRYYPEQKRICSVEGVDVFFMGTQFDQSDLDVYLELLQIAHETPFGVECCFAAHGFLKALGRATGKANHKWLHSVLIRLCAGTVDMTDHGIRYFGHLVDGGIKDEVTKHYTISINPRFARLFKAGMWSSLDIQQRCALGRNQTAKALHAYYSTHAAPGPHTFEKLAALIGLYNKQSRDVRATIIKAHEELKRIGFLSAYEAGPETIKVKINHTPGQARHIVRKIIKARRPRPRKDTV
jgi:hypothetical protein